MASDGDKYNENSKPETWLDYYLVQIGCSDDGVAMNHLPLVLEGSARAWLNHLPPNGIFSWGDSQRVFCQKI
jgi:hypothetical protein